MRRPRTLFALIAAIALLAAACGDGAGDAGDAGDAGTGAGATPTPGTSAATEGATEAPPPPEVDSADGVLSLGYVLPETGPIAFLGPPQIAGVEYAVQQINDAGGVLGEEVTLGGGDEAGDPEVARQTVDRLLADGADAIIGAAASSVSLALIDRIAGTQTVQCSGSNTGATFTDYPDEGFYIRTVPSNVLQGPVLAQRVIEDGAVRVAVASRADDYGRSLGQSVVAALEEAGAEVTADSTYDPALADFAPVANEVTAGDPDAVVLIAFEEGAQLLRELIESGYGPDQIGLYGTDGMPLPDLAGLVNPEDPGVLAGFTATGASSGYDEDFIAALQDFDPDLETTLFAPYTFDCAVVIALAAEAAGTDDPSVFVDELVGVTRDGQECTSFAECRDLLADGEDIDYTGASGPLDFIDAGEPSLGLYDILQIDDTGAVQTVDTVLSQPIPEG